MSGSRCQGRLFQAWPIIKMPGRQTTVSRDSRIVDRRPHLNKALDNRDTRRIWDVDQERYRLPCAMRDWVLQYPEFSRPVCGYFFSSVLFHIEGFVRIMSDVCSYMYVKPIIRFEIILQCENKQEQAARQRGRRWANPTDRVMDQLKWWARLKNGIKPGSFYKNSFAYEPEYMGIFPTAALLPNCQQLAKWTVKMLKYWAKCHKSWPGLPGVWWWSSSPFYVAPT